jgi:hypothetical protein
MNALIDVFRMNELTPSTRTSMIIQLGKLINNEYGSNVTEPIVYELVKILEPDNPILRQKEFLRLALVDIKDEVAR